MVSGRSARPTRARRGTLDVGSRPLVVDIACGWGPGAGSSVTHPDGADAAGVAVPPGGRAVPRGRHRVRFIVLVGALILGSGCRREPEPVKPLPQTPARAPIAPADGPGEPPAVASTPSEDVAGSVRAPTPAPNGRLPPATPAPPRLVVERLVAGDARSAMLSQGGRFAVVLGADDRVQVLDGARGRLVVERRIRPSAVCGTTPFAPSGRQVLVRRQGAVRLVDLFDGGTVREWAGWDRRGMRCALASEGREAVVAEPGRVVVLAVDRDEPLRTLAPAAPGPVTAVFADGRARTLAIAVRDRDRPAAWVWGGAGGTHWRSLSGFEGGSLVLSPDGKRVAGAFGTLKTRIWGVWTGSEERTVPLTTALAFASGGQQLLGMDRDGAAVLVSVETGDILWHHSPFPGIAVAALDSAGQRLLLAGGDRAEDRLALVAPGDGAVRFERRERRLRVVDARWSTDGQDLEVRLAGADRRVIRRATGRVVERPALADPEGLLASGFRRGARWVGRWEARFKGADVAVVDVGRGQLTWSRRLDGAIADVAGSHDGSQVVSVLRDGRVDLRTTADGEVAGAWRVAGGRVLAALTHPHRSELVVVTSDGSVRAVPSGGGEPVWRWSRGRIDRARLSFSAGGERLAVASRRSVVILDTTAAPRELGRIDLGHVPVQAIALAPSGNPLCVSDGVDVRVYDTATQRLRSRVTPLPGGLAVVRAGQHVVFEDQALPYLRWRRGLSLVDRGTDAVNALFAAHRREASEL